MYSKQTSQKLPNMQNSHMLKKIQIFSPEDSIHIPPYIYDKIKARLFDSGISKNTCTEVDIKRILREEHMREYHEYVYAIYSNITGNKKLPWAKEIENKIQIMFNQIQTPFKNHCPKERNNFLNYSYVLHKFFEILEMPEYAEKFPLLKNEEKLRNNDRIWKGICSDLSWKFYPSAEYIDEVDVIEKNDEVTIVDTNMTENIKTNQSDDENYEIIQILPMANIGITE